MALNRARGDSALILDPSRQEPAPRGLHANDGAHPRERGAPGVEGSLVFAHRRNRAAPPAKASGSPVFEPPPSLDLRRGGVLASAAQEPGAGRRYPASIYLGVGTAARRDVRRAKGELGHAPNARQTSLANLKFALHRSRRPRPGLERLARHVSIRVVVSILHPPPLLEQVPVADGSPRRRRPRNVQRLRRPRDGSQRRQPRGVRVYQRAERGSVGEGRLKVGDVHADARAHAACPAKQTNLALGVRVGARRGQRRVGELVGEQSRGPSRFVLVNLLRRALAAVGI